MLYFVMNCLMVLVDILVEYFQQILDSLFFIFLPISNFRKIYKGPPFEYFVNVIIQTLEN